LARVSRRGGCYSTEKVSTTGGTGNFHQQTRSTGASHPRPPVLGQEFRYLVESNDIMKQTNDLRIKQ